MMMIIFRPEFRVGTQASPSVSQAVSTFFQSWLTWLTLTHDYDFRSKFVMLLECLLGIFQIQFQPYSTVSGFIEMGYLMLVGVIMMVFSKFKFGVQLLEKVNYNSIR